MAATAEARPQGVRIEWADVAAPLRRAVEAALGAAVVTAVNQPGGFSPGTAARATLADGRRVFVKAVSDALNPTAVRLHRREADVLTRMPAAMPVPRLLARVDADVDGVDWVAILIEDVDGHLPQRPWRPQELARVLDAIGTIAAVGTPCPVPGLPPVAERDLGGFATLDSEAGAAVLDAWGRDHLAELVALESGWREATVGDSLVQFDARADNIVLTADRAWIVDWPHAVVGAPWVDLMLFLPSAVLDGAPEPEAIWRSHPLGASADPDRADALLAALTGYFLGRAILPPPRGLPTLRAFQRAQGEVALAWLGRRLRGR